MKIFLIRHGRSVANEDKAVHGVIADHAIKLSPTGEEQARRAGRALRDILDERNVANARMWVSPYERTRQTAKLIKEHLSPWSVQDVREHINLVEQQFGLFDGMSHEGTMSEIQRKFPHEYEHYKKCEDYQGKFWARMPLGESRFDVAVRIHQMFGTIKRDEQKHGIDNVIIVAHGLSLRAFVMQWCHFSPEWFEAEQNPNNCSIRLIEDGNDRGNIYAGE